MECSAHIARRQLAAIGGLRPRIAHDDLREADRPEPEQLVALIGDGLQDSCMTYRKVDQRVTPLTERSSRACAVATCVARCASACPSATNAIRTEAASPRPRGERRRPVDNVDQQEALVHTYASSTYGIRFTYPDTYVLSERDEGNAAERTHHVIVLTDRSALSLTPENGEGPPTITIAVFGNAHERLTPESWIKNVSASNFKLSPDNTLATTTIASSTAYTYTWDGLYRGESAVLTHGSDIIMLSVTSLDSADRIRDDFIDMLSTFTLQ